MNTMKADKKENEKKEENEKREENKENPIAFYSLLKGILNMTDISKDNLEKVIFNYLESKKLTNLEKKLFELLLYLNPEKKNYNSPHNRKLLYQIMNLLLIKKGNKKIIRQIKGPEETKKNANDINNYQKVLDIKQNKNLNKMEEEVNNELINSEEIIQICKDAFETEKLIYMLFEDIMDISNKEQYLEMILLFVPDREIQQILKVIKKYLKDENTKEIYESFEKIFRIINLKTENGFRFLKGALIKFTEDKKECIKSIKILESKFIMEENKDLRCTKCFHLPSFSRNDDGIINIRYKCSHIEAKEKSDIQEIKDFKFKCNCNKLVIECNKNFLCSNCKMIVCTLCSKEHFEKCASIFFIPIHDIDNICYEHNEKYEYYCGICEINLCDKCKKEHYHYVEKEKDIYLDKDNLNKFKDIIAKDTKNDKNIISAINNIIIGNKYERNFQFIHFSRKIIGNDINTKSKLFDELFGKEFNDYFKYMKNQIELDNYYYLKILRSFINYYKDKKINSDYSTFLNLKSSQFSQYQLDTMNDNFIKYSLVTRYFKAVTDIKVQKQILNNIIDIKKNTINTEENKILTKSLSNTENLYRNELLKLIDRSIAESLIFYLIDKYSDKFKKINFNSNIFADLENYYKNDKTNFNIIKEKYKGEIQKFSEQTTDNNNENKNIIFDKPVTKKNTSINVDDLNKMLNFLFYIKNLGNFTAHPSNSNKIIINPNNLQINIPKNNDDINKVIEKMENMLKEQSIQNNFILPIKPSLIFNCLFDSNFKSLIKCENDKEMNDIIRNILNESLVEKDDIQKIENIFVNYVEKIKILQDILEDLNQYNNFKDQESFQKSKSLNEFLARLEQLLMNEEKILSFLFRLNKNKYETSITGEKYAFFSYCLNYIIAKITSKLNQKINDYQKDKENLEKLIQSKEKIISFLTNLNKNMDI